MRKQWSAAGARAKTPVGGGGTKTPVGGGGEGARKQRSAAGARGRESSGRRIAVKGAAEDGVEGYDFT